MRKNEYLRRIENSAEISYIKAFLKCERLLKNDSSFDAQIAGFAQLLASHGTPSSILDLGAGGGIPGLFLAVLFEGVAVTLLDRSTRRTIVAEIIIRNLKLESRVKAVCADAREWTPQNNFGAVVARCFGKVEGLIALGPKFVAEGGLILATISNEVDFRDLKKVEKSLTNAAAVGLELRKSFGMSFVLGKKVSRET